MRIVSWNCNLKLAKKFDQVAELKPDILVVQECERLPVDYFPGASFHWLGQSENKGLGVVLFGQRTRIASCYDNKLAFFLPLELEGGVHLLACWAFNHRAATRFGEEFRGSAVDALEHYNDWLNQGQTAMVIGDFNNSVVWDKKNKHSNFANIDTGMKALGLHSAYHTVTGEVFGEEQKPTLFHTKNKDKPYHIDYCYLPESMNCEVKVGKFDEWIGVSDHMPLIVDVI